MSRHRSLVATSLYAFAGFNWSLLMSRHRYLVTTLAQVFCSFQLIVHDVTTSISCRDISLCLWRLHWLLSVSRLQSSVATTASVKSTSSFQTCHSFKAILLSRPPSLHNINPCRDITMLSRHHSFSLWLILICLSGDSCRDLHQILSIILMSRPHNLDYASPKLHQ